MILDEMPLPVGIISNPGAVEDAHILDSNSMTKLQDRLSKLLDHIHNKVCADCPTLKPRNVSLLQKPLVKGGNQIGVFCCDQCAIEHRKLGTEVARVKSVQDACKFSSFFKSFVRGKH